MRISLIAAAMIVIVAAVFPFFPAFSYESGEAGVSSLNSDFQNSFGSDGSLLPASSDSGAGGGSGSGGKSEDSGLLSRILNALTSLPEAIVDKMLDSVMEFWGQAVDSFLEMACGVLGSAFLKTAYPGHIDWVSRGNVVLWITCLAISILFLTFAVLGVMRGKRSAGEVVGTFLVGVLLSVFSVQIANALVWAANTVSAGLWQTALVAYNSQTAPEIHVVTAFQIVSMPFQNPASFGTQIPFHALFLDTGDASARFAQGGIVALLLAAGGWLAVSFLAAARMLALCVATMLAPIYVSMAVFASRPEPAVGWLVLMVRTTFIQVFWALAWQLMVFIQAEYSSKNLADLFGPSPVLANIAVLYAMAFITLRFWLLPTTAQMMQPVTLAGGRVMEKAGALGEKAGQAVSVLGMATLNEGFVLTGKAIQRAGKTAKNQGAAMHGDRSVTDAFDLSQSPQAPRISAPNPASGALKDIEDRYNWHKNLEKKNERERRIKRYWTRNGKFLIMNRHGLLVEVPSPPEGYVYQGEVKHSL